MKRRNTAPFDGRLVSFPHTFESDSLSKPRVSQSTLQFLDAATLNAEHAAAGLALDDHFDDWDRSPLVDADLEIITIARRVWGSSATLPHCLTPRDPVQ